MPRMGLTPDKVVDEAACVADELGIEGLSLAAVAARLGVRVPSLYKHIGGLDDLQRRLAQQGARGLVAAVAAGAHRADGRDQLLAVASAYRGYAQQNPGRFQAMARRAALGGASTQLEALLRWAVSQYGVDETRQAAQAVHSALHGFVLLEAGGAYPTAQAADVAFGGLLAVLRNGVTRVPNRSSRAVRLPAAGLRRR